MHGRINTHKIRLRAADTNAANAAYVRASSSVGREGARIELGVEVVAVTEADRSCFLIHMRRGANKAD
jgi:hypothetical protein